MKAKPGKPNLHHSIIYNTGVAIKTFWYWFLFLSLASAADWLNQGTVQKDEKQLTVANVHKLKLLWKRPLDSTLTSPVMLGPIITHRGIKELVFVAAASNTLYAVDADLGRVFWTRKFDGPGTLTATPAIAPYTNPNPSAEWSTPLRPIYVATGDGMLHSVRASDGEDMDSPRKFLAPGATPSGLIVSQKSVQVIAEKTSATVQVNGIIFSVSSRLTATDANGMQLYLGAENIPAPIAPGGLAVANGHVCFAAAQTLYCFGIPFEI